MIVGVIDYGMGNLRSVQGALETLGCEVRVSGDVDALAGCKRLILPGVGSFFRAMENVRARGLDRAIHRLVDEGKPLLGICLGMQLLAREGAEDGRGEGLGFFDASVERLPSSAPHVPHVGFNSVRFAPRAGALSASLGEAADFYFVHSYRMVCRDAADVAGVCQYGEPFAALVRRGRVAGAQFHPEKSQSNGLKLLAAFLSPSFLST